jgi:hypothetical protein
MDRPAWATSVDILVASPKTSLWVAHFDGDVVDACGTVGGEAAVVEGPDLAVGLGNPGPDGAEELLPQVAIDKPSI